MKTLILSIILASCGGSQFSLPSFLCPPGDVPCGISCMPSGNVCCNDEADNNNCQPGWKCINNGADCIPDDSVYCGNGTYCQSPSNECCGGDECCVSIVVK